MRHLISAAKHRKSERQVYAAFIDFTQAYDNVNRTLLWQHLSKLNVPIPHRKAIEGLYEDDSYVLTDGDKCTDSIKTRRGVRQGCPLSPLLFALFVNDVAIFMPSGLGARAMEETLKVSHIMYADDLTLLSNSEENLPWMLDKLDTYANEKELTVNVKKSQVMVFNKPRGRGELPSFRLGGTCLEVVSDFKYLGMFFEESGGLTRASEAASSTFMAGIGRVNQMAVEHCVSDNPQAMLWLFQIFALPTGLYGAQIWSTKDFLKALKKPED